MGDINRVYYRTKEEEQEWMSQRDPLTLWKQWLADNQIASPATTAQLEQEVATEVADGVEFALSAPYPDPSEVAEDVFA